MNEGMKKRKEVSGKQELDQYCECCNWRDYPIALTLHHIFPKGHFRHQPDFSRRFRYLIVCPTCHHLIHIGILTKKTIDLISEKLSQCEEFYCNYPNITTIISKCKKIYNLD